MANILKFFSALLTYKLMLQTYRQMYKSHKRCAQVFPQGQKSAIHWYDNFVRKPPSSALIVIHY